MLIDTNTLADAIIYEVKTFDLLKESSFKGTNMESMLLEFQQICEQAYNGAFTLGIPENTRFRFIKRVINKLIRPSTRQQVEFNYQIINLIKIQQNIILKENETLSELTSAYAELNYKLKNTLKKVQG